MDEGALSTLEKYCSKEQSQKPTFSKVSVFDDVELRSIKKSIKEQQVEKLRRKRQLSRYIDDDYDEFRFRAESHVVVNS